MTRSVSAREETSASVSCATTAVLASLTTGTIVGFADDVTVAIRRAAGARLRSRGLGDPSQRRLAGTAERARGAERGEDGFGRADADARHFSDFSRARRFQPFQ